MLNLCIKSMKPKRNIRVKSGKKDAFHNYEDVLRFIKKNRCYNKRQLLYLVKEHFGLTEQDLLRYQAVDLLVIECDVIVITPQSDEILHILSECL